jgi:hypothetical protein
MEGVPREVDNVAFYMTAERKRPCRHSTWAQANRDLWLLLSNPVSIFFGFGAVYTWGEIGIFFGLMALAILLGHLSR